MKQSVNGLCPVPFESLEQLRASHAELLKRHRKEGDSNLFESDVEEFIFRGRETGAFVDCPDDRVEGQHLLDYWATIMSRAEREPPDATLADFDANRLPSLPDELCPYVGLEAFTESSHHHFFGRFKTVAQLSARLSESRFLAVVGPSGSGKSSVVQAGLLPLVKAGGAPECPDSKGWNYIGTMMPGSHPLENLLQTLFPVDDRAMLTQKAELLRLQPEEIVRILETCSGTHPSLWWINLKKPLPCVRMTASVTHSAELC